MTNDDYNDMADQAHRDWVESEEREKLEAALAQKDAEMSSLRSECAVLREGLEYVSERDGWVFDISDNAKEALARADAIRSGVKE